MIRYKMRLTPFPLLELADISPCSLLQRLYVEVYRCFTDHLRKWKWRVSLHLVSLIKNLMDEICNTASSLFYAFSRASLELVSPRSPQEPKRNCALQLREPSDLWFDCLEIDLSPRIQEFMSRICDLTFPGWSNKQPVFEPFQWINPFPIDHPTSLKTLRVLQYYRSRFVWCKNKQIAIITGNQYLQIRTKRSYFWWWFSESAIGRTYI